MSRKIICVGIFVLFLLTSLTFVSAEKIEADNDLPDLEIISLSIRNLYRERQELELPFEPYELAIQMEVLNKGAPINPDYRFDETGMEYMVVNCHFFIDGDIVMALYQDHGWQPDKIQFVITDDTGPWEKDEVKRVGFDYDYLGTSFFNITDTEIHTISVEVDVEDSTSPYCVTIEESDEANNIESTNYKIPNTAPSIKEQPVLSKLVRGEYCYFVEGTDSEADGLKYHWDMDGDGICDPSFPSDDKITNSNKYYSTSKFENAKVKIVDAYGAESEWSNTIEIKCRSKSFLQNIILKLLDSNPFLQRFLKL